MKLTKSYLIFVVLYRQILVCENHVLFIIALVGLLLSHKAYTWPLLYKEDQYTVHQPIQI
jgi:hypothetical protein